MNLGLHHLSRRKQKKQEKYPSTNPFKRGLDRLMFFVAIATPFVLLPQVLQLFTYKDAAGLSLYTWFLLGCINILWAVYGLLHKEFPIVIANSLVGVLNFVLVYGILLYS